jgi:2-iminobutanoate/2-iminopropanoate deaminase
MPEIWHVDVPGYPAANSPCSHAVVANGFVFVSGHIPVRPGGGSNEVVGDTMQEQTRQSIRNVRTILEAAGSSLERVVKVTVLLARPDLYKEMNEAYAEFFPGAKPARAMVRFGADIPGVLVAIEAIALAEGLRFWRWSLPILSRAITSLSTSKPGSFIMVGIRSTNEYEAAPCSREPDNPPVIP